MSMDDDNYKDKFRGFLKDSPEISHDEYMAGVEGIIRYKEETDDLEACEIEGHRKHRRNQAQEIWDEYKKEFL